MLLNVTKAIKLSIISWQDAPRWPSACQKIFYPITTIDLELPKNSFALSVTEDNWDAFLQNTLLIVAYSSNVENRDYVITHKKDQETA